MQRSCDCDLVGLLTSGHGLLAITPTELAFTATHDCLALTIQNKLYGAHSVTACTRSSAALCLLM